MLRYIFVLHKNINSSVSIIACATFRLRTKRNNKTLESTLKENVTSDIWCCYEPRYNFVGTNYNTNGTKHAHSNGGGSQWRSGQFPAIHLKWTLASAPPAGRMHALLGHYNQENYTAVGNWNLLLICTTWWDGEFNGGTLFELSLEMCLLKSF